MWDTGVNLSVGGRIGAGSSEHTVRAVAEPAHGLMGLRSPLLIVSSRWRRVSERREAGSKFAAVGSADERAAWPAQAQTGP
jgi:hypothetical protein